MSFAKLIIEEKEGLTLLMNEEDYDEYVKVLCEWVNEMQEREMNEVYKSKKKTKKTKETEEERVKKIFLTKDKIF